ncbi:MAG: hypothetical protein K2O42_11010 [Oscillospiraceae bacterium]|nr:hypothetical protein [Oscillospiraceae bacterium]
MIALLDQVFPEYADLFSDTFGKSSQEVLQLCPTPEEMLAVSTRKLANLLNKASKGRFKKEKAEQLKQAAQNTFGISFATDAFFFRSNSSFNRFLFSKISFLNLNSRFQNCFIRPTSFSQQSLASVMFLVL